MHPSEIPANHAIAVTADGIIPYRENDVVIVGIRCWVNESGELVPFNNNIQLFRKEFNQELGRDVFLFKRNTK